MVSVLSSRVSPERAKAQYYIMGVGVVRVNPLGKCIFGTFTLVTLNEKIK